MSTDAARDALADCPRNELVTAIHMLASHFENALGAFRDDAEALRKAKGDIAHAMKIAAKHNQNGPGCAVLSEQPAERTPEQRAADKALMAEMSMPVPQPAPSWCLPDGLRRYIREVDRGFEWLDGRYTPTVIVRMQFAPNDDQAWTAPATLANWLAAAPSPTTQPAPSLAMHTREALELIAAPKRPDGTWNRDREACRQIAADALGMKAPAAQHLN